MPGHVIQIGADGADNWNTPPPGQPGSEPPAGAGHPATEASDGKSCSVQATQGQPGKDGETGRIGPDGGTPGNAEVITWNVPEMKGEYVFENTGGKAGSGGKGGKGGTGQAGGPGGSGTSHCPPGPQGQGGKGGLGGDGGKGPDGGKAADIYVWWKTGDPVITAKVAAGEGGKGAPPGDGGEPGAGNPAGGTLGSGKSGTTGKAGVNGQILVNGKPQKP